MTTTINTIAAGLNDGYADLIAQRAKLTAASKQNQADFPHPLDPVAAAREYLAGGASLRDLAAQEVRGRRVLAEVLQTESGYIHNAQGLVSAQIEAWLSSHQEALCEGLQEARVDVQARARVLLKSRHPDPDQMRALVAEWRELRREHTDLIGVQALDPVLRWRGLDWVGDYASAWPEFWRVDRLKEPLPEDVRPVRPPFDPQVVQLTEADGPDPLTDREFLDQLVRVKVWTPTRRQYDTTSALLDVTGNRRRLEYARELEEQRKAKTVSLAAPTGFLTVTKDPWR